MVRPTDVAGKIPCGDDVGAVVKAAGEFFDAGFTDLALVQSGGDRQHSFSKAAGDDGRGRRGGGMVAAPPAAA